MCSRSSQEYVSSYQLLILKLIGYLFRLPLFYQKRRRATQQEERLFSVLKLNILNTGRENTYYG